jgi:hypothetical protein
MASFYSDHHHRRQFETETISVNIVSRCADHFPEKPTFSSSDFASSQTELRRNPTVSGRRISYQMAALACLVFRFPL